MANTAMVPRPAVSSLVNTQHWQAWPFSQWFGCWLVALLGHLASFVVSCGLELGVLHARRNRNSNSNRIARAGASNTCTSRQSAVSCSLISLGIDR